MNQTNRNIYQDDVVVLKTKDWQTVDRMAEGFSLEHGRILFIAYGAKHMRNRSSALVQNLTHARMQLSVGRKFDTLRQCELLPQLVTDSDLEHLAYASFITELTAEITPEREPNADIYEVLVSSLQAVNHRNPRLIALSFAMKLLNLCGVGPSFETCVSCGAPIEGDVWASAVQGGCVCAECKTGAETAFAESVQVLAQTLLHLDPLAEGAFSVKGKDMIALETFLHKFIIMQVEKPLKSLSFLASM